jgi:DNA replication licensing factor MCM7
MMESGAAAVGDGSRGELNMRRVSELVIAKGFTRDQLTHCIDEYALLDVSFVVSILHLQLIANANRVIQVWQVANNGTRLVFIDAGDDEDYMDVGSEDDVE